MFIFIHVESIRKSCDARTPVKLAVILYLAFHIGRKVHSKSDHQIDSTTASGLNSQVLSTRQLANPQSLNIYAMNRSFTNKQICMSLPLRFCSACITTEVLLRQAYSMAVVDIRRLPFVLLEDKLFCAVIHRSQHECFGFSDMNFYHVGRLSDVCFRIR